MPGLRKINARRAMLWHQKAANGINIQSSSSILGRSVMKTRKVLLRLGFLLLLVFVLEAPAALAKCHDRPKPGVDWTRCEKERLILRKVDLSGAILKLTDLSGTDMTGARLVGAILVQANLARAHLHGADLSGADMSKARADRTEFQDANLSRVNLSKAELPRANLAGADLSGADMSKAELPRAVFTKTQLAGANMRYTTIARADFRGTTLNGVNLGGAYMLLTHFEGADLSRAKGLIQQQIEIACGDDKTKLPSNLQRPASWPCAEGE